jgi:hypothetical protein
VDGGETFTLTAYLPEQPSDTEALCMQKIKANVGWDLQVSSHLGRLPPADQADLTLLRLFDPRGFYIG